VATVRNGVARALLAGGADVGLSGPLRALGALDRGEGRLVCVAEVNSRVGFFLLGRAPAHDFGWRDLAGRRVLVFAEAPTPRLCLEYLLERHGVRPGAVELTPTCRRRRRWSACRRADHRPGQPVTERLVAAAGPRRGGPGPASAMRSALTGRGAS
jgi:hypothetical protein